GIAGTRRPATAGPIGPTQSGQLMCYKTGQVYLLLTGRILGLDKRIERLSNHRHLSMVGSGGD
ncbi:MAG: hypothetical protein D6698_12895, partial [Gammaproteobacteria bacterium]